MPSRRSRNSIAANPVLIGAATTLIIIVGVFLSYNANNGLPFVPTYQIKAQVPDAAELVVGNDVRIGGTRVGVVKKITARREANRSIAILDLALEKRLQPLRDSTQVLIRQRSNLGLKYVDLEPGRGGQKLAEGGTLPIQRSTPVVDLDDALSTFDAKTRTATRSLLQDFGTGLAGRAGDLSQTLQDAPDVLTDLQTVTRVVSAPSTGLVRFIDSALSAAQAVAPVRPQLSDLLDAGATTFRAIAAEDSSIGDTLDVAPSAESETSRALTALRPALQQTRLFLSAARPGLRELPASADKLSRGLQNSGPVLQRTRPIAGELTQTLSSLRSLSRRPSVAPSLRRLSATAVPLADALKTINPFQTRCNYLGLWTRNVPDVISEGDSLGTWFRFIPIFKTNEQTRSPGPASDLHADPDPDTGAGGTCEPGNETYASGQQIGHSPGTVPGTTQDTAINRSTTP